MGRSGTPVRARPTDGRGPGHDRPALLPAPGDPRPLGCADPASPSSSPSRSCRRSAPPSPRRTSPSVSRSRALGLRRHRPGIAYGVRLLFCAAWVYAGAHFWMQSTSWPWPPERRHRGTSRRTRQLRLRPRAARLAGDRRRRALGRDRPPRRPPPSRPRTHRHRTASQSHPAPAGPAARSAAAQVRRQSVRGARSGAPSRPGGDPPPVPRVHAAVPLGLGGKPGSRTPRARRRKGQADPTRLRDPARTTPNPGLPQPHG
jgi:hypothetical protein